MVSRQLARRFFLREQRARPLRLAMQSRDGHADEGVEGVPDEVEGRDFVSDEFNAEQRSAGRDHRPAFEDLQSGRKREMSEAGKQSQNSNGRIEVQAGCEADCYQQREEFGGRNFQDVEHSARQGLKPPVRYAFNAALKDCSSTILDSVKRCP